jgi:hypothetical protein
MGKEKLRELFGNVGDIIPELESMFGNTYLDSPDRTKEGVWPELNATGACKINYLIDKVTKEAVETDCHFNQTTVLSFLNGYITNQDLVSTNDWWVVIKHMDKCFSSKCKELYEIACKDKYLTPEQMFETYGEIIEKFKIGG